MLKMASMSWWGTLDAYFLDCASPFVHATALLEGCPQGTEYGLIAREEGEKTYSVSGRLRDVNDERDSTRALAWFTDQIEQLLPREASLTFELDGTPGEKLANVPVAGPRYRYVWQDGELTRLKGVLD